MDREFYQKVLDYDKKDIPEDRRPDNGYVWVCATCGKIAADRYGEIGPQSGGYDESCMLNSIQAKLTAVGWKARE